MPESAGPELSQAVVEQAPDAIIFAEAASPSGRTADT